MAAGFQPAGRVVDRRVTKRRRPWRQGCRCGTRRRVTRLLVPPPRRLEARGHHARAAPWPGVAACTFPASSPGAPRRGRRGGLNRRHVPSPSLRDVPGGWGCAWWWWFPGYDVRARLTACGEIRTQAEPSPRGTGSEGQSSGTGDIDELDRRGRSGDGSSLCFHCLQMKLNGLPDQVESFVSSRSDGYATGEVGYVGSPATGTLLRPHEVSHRYECGSPWAMGRAFEARVSLAVAL